MINNRCVCQCLYDTASFDTCRKYDASSFVCNITTQQRSLIGSDTETLHWYTKQTSAQYVISIWRFIIFSRPY